MNEHKTADQVSIGYAMATFRSHYLHATAKWMKWGTGDWYMPDRSYEAGDGYKADCHCRQFVVSEFQHYHGEDGVCHRLDKCT